MERAVRAFVDLHFRRAQLHGAHAARRFAAGWLRACHRLHFRLHLRGALLKEILDALLCLFVPLRDRGGERFHHVAAGAVLLGDARQHIHDREVRARRIGGDALGQLDALREPLALADQIMREAEGLPLLGAVGAAGEHQVHHARDADQARDAHRAAAADKDAARAFGQRVVGGTLRDADVRRGRKLQPAADHRAMHHGDDRHAAELDLVEDAVPDGRMRNALFGAQHFQLGQIEAGGEMLAFGVQHDGFHARGQRVEERLDAEHGRVVQRIALLGTRQGQDRDRAAPLHLQGFRQLARPLRHVSCPCFEIVMVHHISTEMGQAPHRSARLVNTPHGRYNRPNKPQRQGGHP